MTSREQGAGSKQRVIGVGGKAECIAFAACLLIVTCDVASARAAFTFNDIEFWVGTGANRAVLVIDWKENASQPPALAWGYRWEGTAHGNDMLSAIVAADTRLFAKVGGSFFDPEAVYGLGYDANGDGLFSIDDGTQFDANGFAGGRDDHGVSNDPGDYYAEGWFAGFWHYGVEDPIGANPYGSGDWSDTGAGMATRELADGAWDSWVFTPTFDFGAFAQNPVAAPSPFPPGDFNRDGEVDASDYGVWTSTFGSTTQPAADANRDGVVDAADYVIWREQFTISGTASSATTMANVPEPTMILLSNIATLFFQFTIRKRPQINADERRFRKNCLRSSVSIRGFFPAA